MDGGEVTETGPLQRTSKICFAILAHTNRPCLDDQVRNLRTFAPTADVVLFNGGRDPNLADGLDIDVCPYSQPLRYERVARFHGEIMRWLHETGREFDFLVTIDSDVLLIKHGFEAFLDRAMADSAYMGVLFRRVEKDTEWITGRRFHYVWRRAWQPIFEVEHPYGCFCPGQVFRGEYVERLLRFPRLDELFERIERSRLRDLEELIWATLAVTLECNPRRYPDAVSASVRYRKRHAPGEIRAYLDDPDVFLLHPVPMSLDAPERRLIRLLREGAPVDFDALQEAFEQEIVPVPNHLRIRGSLFSPLLSKAYDAYLRVAPE